jgi:biotin-dependent carboxylase-like uncharacterized protein
VSGPGSRWIRVLDPGPLTTVQDGGRPGWATLGVPRAGWLDPVSATLGNRLVGNPEDAAALECLLGGCALRAGTALTLAVTGGRCTVTVAGRPAPHSEALSVPAGARVVLGRVTAGLRMYVAVAGGVAVAPVLGSRSTDTLSWTGPPQVSTGEVLPVGVPPGPPPALAGPVVTRPGVLPPASGPADLRFTPGPRADWFEPGALSVLGARPWVVQPDSDRVALRLAVASSAADDGSGSDSSGGRLRRRPDAPRELPSEGLVLGAVQVPPSGRPLVFLADHPTTGGYPVVAVVARDDLPLCAHLRPGDRVSFRPG